MMRPDSYDSIAAILSIHSMIHGFIAATVADVLESRMTEQPGGGSIVNHPAWTLSHLNAYSATLLSMLDDPSVPSAAAAVEIERFGYGTKPVPDRAAYASKRELLDTFSNRSARLSAIVAAKHAEYFPRPSPEKYHPHAPTIGHIAIVLLIAHPPHHLGQLRQWRRAVGIADVA